MICSLLLLYASDGQRTNTDLLHHLKGIPSHSICVDDPNFSKHHALCSPASGSRIQIVFFSPGFLKFLECKYDEAYSSFRNLDPSSTVALFCCGLREREVMCYHIAPLNSYNSWPKFEATNQENGSESNVFSPYLMQLIEEVFPAEDYPARNVILVPEILKRESNIMYLIFSNPIENSADISVQIENRSNLSIEPENFNPYVMQFRVPVTLLENRETFTVQIHQSGSVLVEKLIRVVQDPTARDRLQRKDSRLEANSKLIILEKELQVLTDIGGISLDKLENICDDRMCTLLPSQEEMNHSLKHLCRKYGLEELSMFIEEPPGIQNTLFCRSTNIAENDFNDRIYTGTDPHIITPSDDAEVMSAVTRSLSLPLNLAPKDDLESGDYLPMNQLNTRPRSHLLPSMDNTLSVNEILSNNTYVCMTLGRDSGSLMEAAKKVLSQSQQELLEIMNDFKKGRNTISDVEGRFQMWQEKHGCHDKQSQDYEAEEFSKHPTTFFGGGWNIFKRKTSNASDSGRRLSGFSVQSQETIRKSSIASASSTSSKASDSSGLTVYNQQHSETAKSSTGWIPAFSTTVYPLIPELTPPLLSARPRPCSRSKIEETKKSLKRRAGTHLTLALNEQLYTKDKPMETTDECDSELVQSLLEACGKYSLEPLGEYFIAEYRSAKKSNSKNMEVAADKNLDLSKNKEHDRLSQFTSIENDLDNTISLRRSLSLPNALLPTEGTKDAVPPGGNPELHGPECSQHTSVYKYEEYVHSIHSNIYASIRSIMESNDRGRTPNLGSQQELFELLEAFKKGGRTISQVEREFQAWNERHLGSSAMRENELILLQNMYKKAQRPFFIKTPKILKTLKSPDNSKSTKTNADKAENDKDSSTRPSSTISDNGDVFKNCVYNPEYVKKPQDAVLTEPKSRRTSSSEPPPLPPRPPLQPINVMRSCYTHDKNADWYGRPAKPVAAVHKPCPPPKPPNLYKKASTFEVDKREEKDAEPRPASPVYITPNPFLPAAQRKKTSVPATTTPKTTNGDQRNNNSPCHVCPVSVAHVCHKTSVTKANWNSSSCPTTLTKTDSSKKNATSASPSKQADNSSQKWQFLPNPWATKQKKEESMFYITRRWSSVPDDIQLSVGPDQKPEPIYLELIDQCDSRIRSISESNPPKDSKIE